MKVGVVGVGKMGEFHLQKFLQIPSAEVVGFFDTDRERSAQISARYGLVPAASLAELLFEADAVAIASPTFTHYAVARQALEAGVRVLIEKPIADSVLSGEKLVGLSREQGLPIAVGLVERFRFLALKRGLQLGKIRFIETHRLSPFLSREKDVDVVTDLMIHDLDLVLSLMGAEPSFLSAIGVAVITKHFDLANVRLEFGSGSVANLSASRVSSRAVRTLRVFSGQGYVSIDFMTNTLKHYFVNAHQKIEGSEVAGASVDALLEQNRHFVDCVAGNKTPIVTGEDGVRALRVAKLIKDRISERALLAEAPPEGRSGRSHARSLKDRGTPA